MELERRLIKVRRYHLALFLLPILSLLYYGWWDAGSLAQRPDNPLRSSPLSLRGDIDDRNGRKLAHTVNDGRVYPLGEAAGALVGYHLRGRNQSGLEASLQEELSPPTPPKSLWGAVAMDRDRVEGRSPLKGPSVELTIDSVLQQHLYHSLAPEAGAVLVVDTAKGDVLAAVSSPSFDPERIGPDWQELRNDPRSPLIERVGSGLYPVQRSNGQEIFGPGKLARSSWFAGNPFPLYPGASSSLEIEGRQFYSPLMLAVLAGRESKGQSVLEPRLMKTSQAMVVDLPRRAPQDYPEPLALKEGTVTKNLIHWNLAGPKFDRSPPFEATVGRGKSVRGAFVFVVVVEDAESSKKSGTSAKILKILQNWLDGSLEGSES